MPSIFRKDCPQCAAANEVQALRCSCGYRFESENGDDTADLETQEQLYRDYLAARVIQAEAALAVAREQAADDPQSTYKNAQALLAEQALNTARAQLEVHGLRAVSAKHRHSAKAALIEAAPAATGPSIPIDTVGRTTPASSASPGAASTMTAIAAPRTPAAPAGAVKPDEVFRRIQAAKAKAALRAQRALAVAAPPAKAVAVPPKPAASPAATTAKQECPHCTAAVAVSAKACHCGYVFPTHGLELPALTLDAATRAVLNEVLSPTGTTRRR